MDNFIDPRLSRALRADSPADGTGLKATTLMSMAMETSVSKIRNTHVSDDEEDYASVPAGARVSDHPGAGEARSARANCPGWNSRRVWRISYPARAG